MASLFGQFVNNRVGKGLPALILMRAGLMGAYGQSRVQQQDALVRPAQQVSALRNGLA